MVTALGFDKQTNDLRQLGDGVGSRSDPSRILLSYSSSPCHSSPCGRVTCDTIYLDAPVKSCFRFPISPAQFFDCLQPISSSNGPMESRDIAPTLFFLVLPVSLVLLYLQVSAIRLSRRRGHIPSPSLHIASVFFVALTAIICSTIAIIGTIAYVERADTSRTTRYQLGEEVSTDFLKLLCKLETFVLPTITLGLTELTP